MAYEDTAEFISQKLRFPCTIRLSKHDSTESSAGEDSEPQNTAKESLDTLAVLRSNQSVSETKSVMEKENAKTSQQQLKRWLKS